jgi:hypothetical protein
MTEHSGGTPKIGLVPIEWNEGVSFELTPVFEWDPRSLDHFSDLAAEYREHGGDPKELLMRVLEPELQQLLATALRRMLGLIRHSKRPALAVDQLAWICGLSLMENVSLGKLAKSHNMSKQAFEQGADHYRQILTLRSQSARSEKARENMSRRNYRHQSRANVDHALAQ